ncbi:reverse transcriptase domain-containing protein [Tanacetum coccineum]
MEVEEELPEPWILFTDGSSCTNGSGARLILINPEGMEFTYALRFRFDATNNEAEYEALIAGLRIAEQMGTLSVVAKALRIVYYWPIMHKDARTLIRACQDCQVHKPVPRNPLGEGIKARLEARSKNWMEELSHVLWAHRTMIKNSNGDTPFSLTYETEAVIPVEIGMPTLRTAEIDIAQNNESLEVNLDLLEERREQAAIREAKSKAKIEKYYNSKVRSTSFKPGDLVYCNNDASCAEDTGKLGPKWE